MIVLGLHWIPDSKYCFSGGAGVSSDEGDVDEGFFDCCDGEAWWLAAAGSCAAAWVYNLIAFDVVFHCDMGVAVKGGFAF